MPKGACLINTARKEVIDEDGLLEIMEKRADFSYLSDIEPGVKDVFAEKYQGRYFFTPKKNKDFSAIKGYLLSMHKKLGTRNPDAI